MNRDALKREFWALKKQIDAEQAIVDKKRETVDAQLQAAREAVKSLMDEIRVLEEPLFTKKNDLGDIARQLRGPDGIVDTALPEHTVNRSN